MSKSEDWAGCQFPIRPTGQAPVGAIREAALGRCAAKQAGVAATSFRGNEMELDSKRDRLNGLHRSTLRAGLVQRDQNRGPHDSINGRSKTGPQLSAPANALDVGRNKPSTNPANRLGVDFLLTYPLCRGWGYRN